MSIGNYDHWTQDCEGTQLSLNYSKGKGYQIYQNPCHRDKPSSQFVSISIMGDGCSSKVILACKRSSSKLQVEAIALFDEAIKKYIAENPIAVIEAFTAKAGDQFIIKSSSWGDKTVVVNSEDGDRWGCFDVKLYWETDTPLPDDSSLRSYDYATLSSAERIEPMPDDKLEKMRDSWKFIQEQREEVDQERKAFIEAGKKLVPAWAKAVIIGRSKQDQSDSQTDYFGSSTTRTVVLAFSTNQRDDFKEMRKAAILMPETAHLVESDHEHREKYSMGQGYYLGTSRHSGWQVSKYYPATNEEFLYALGRDGGLPTPKNKEVPLSPETTQASDAGVEVYPNDTLSPETTQDSVKVRRNEAKEGIEIVFEVKPPLNTREMLKRYGFRWSRTGDLWYSPYTESKFSAVKAEFASLSS